MQKYILNIIPALFLGSCGLHTSDHSSTNAVGNRINSRSDIATQSVVAILNTNGKQICSGVAVSKTKILTAGHCGSPGDIKIVDFNLKVGTDSSRRIRGSFVQHPHYINDNQFSFDGDVTFAALNDVATITLESKIPREWGVRIPKLSTTSPKIGDNLRSLGYGKGYSIVNGRTISDSYVLREANGRVFGKPRLGSTVTSRYSLNGVNSFSKNKDERYYKLSQMMFSVIQDKVRVNGESISTYTCSGDSGGGVFNSIGDLVGIISAGPDKVEYGGTYPGNYQRYCESGVSYMVDTSKYYNWIRRDRLDAHNQEVVKTPLFKSPTGIRDESGKMINKTFNIINSTINEDILELYVAPDFSDSWGFNIIPGRTLSKEDQLMIYIGDRTCTYRFKVILRHRQTGELKTDINSGNICSDNITKLTYN